MSYLKTKGIVIREVNTGDADKIITLLTDNRGKISVFLKNARRMKNKAIASSQLFCYSDFVLFKGKDLYSLNSSETIEAFYNIRCELVKLTYASHILEIINDTAQEGQSAFSMQKLLLNTLFMLNKNNINDELITRIFELRLMKILGFSPSIDSCIRCANIKLDPIFFCFDECGFICSDCINDTKNSIKISLSAAKAIIHILTCDKKDIFRFGIKDEVLFELSGFSSRYISERLDKNYKKLDYLKGLL